MTRQIEIIGEAARRVSEASQAEVPEISWHQIIGMRNRISHEYDRLNLATIWDTVRIALPQLIVVLEPIVPSEEP